VDKVFTYAIPDHLAILLQAGQRVLAPFGRGNRPVRGFCVEITADRPACEVKSILRVLDESPLLSPALLRLTRWMAEYYLSSWGQVLEAVVPAGAKAQAGTRRVLLLQAVPEERLPVPAPRLTTRQARVYSLLRVADGPMDRKELARLAGCGLAVLNGLVEKGYAELIEQRVEAIQPVTEETEPQEPISLNANQLRAVAAVEQALFSGQFRAFLLHGVTGSGKTEIYLRAIEQAVRQGKEAIVLVPEISLTPQTIQRFQGRFPHVAVLHSHLSDAERGWHWRRIAAGQVQVVVGARSAVFAPTRRLGLLVVDEEHETSFKQETTPRYHGRDVAVMRAKLENVPILLGSATPSLESWHNVERKQYTLLSLPVRVLDRPLPQVHLIDLRHEGPRPGRFRAISPTLERAMKDALDRGGQVILLLNRRGFDTCLLCPACGHVVKCKFCEVALTHHRQQELALCHYCGYEQAPPERCPECGLSQVKYLGQGTEKLEAEVAKRFAGVTAERMDSDTMRRPGAHARVLGAFRRGEIRILLGTQMIAKGLDFPDVTLVGVVNADTALYLPDFRAAERTFQLLAQVAGRTGRGPSGGRVLVQTFNPEHPCVALAAQHDYGKFAAWELAQRREHGYPPYQRMARVILRGKKRDEVQTTAETLAARFREEIARLLGTSTGRPAAIRLLGPAEAPLARLKGYHRYHFQLQSPSSAALHDLLRKVLDGFRASRGVEIAVDIDPWHML
jgi:primosomal protein N' (replication factor Y)